MMRASRWLPWLLTVCSFVAIAALLIGRRSPTGGPAGQRLSPGRENVRTDFGSRVAQLEEQLRRQPNDTAALGMLGRMWHDAHRPAFAATYYRRYLALNDGAKQVWLDLADCYASLGQWHRALDATESLLARFPNDPAAMYNAGAVNANLGDSVAATVWFRRVADQRGASDLAVRAREALGRLGASAP